MSGWLSLVLHSRHSPRQMKRRSLGLVFFLLASGIAGVRASAPENARDPVGRGGQLLGGREAALVSQTQETNARARTRAMWLYRVLKVRAGEPAWGGSDVASGRAVALATAVLARDLDEASTLQSELERVRAQRAILALKSSRSETDSSRTAPSLFAGGAATKPVAGPLLTPFGVSREPITGAWMFRAAATYAAAASEPVRAPASGRVVRVTNSVAGGAALVLSHAGGWTSIVSGMTSVRVAEGDEVGFGDDVGTAFPGRTDNGAICAVPPIRVELWHGRTPMDPAAFLRARSVARY